MLGPEGQVRIGQSYLFSLADRQRLDMDPDPNFHFAANPDQDPALFSANVEKNNLLSIHIH